MKIMPEDGDRVQEIGYAPRKGILLNSWFDDKRGVDVAEVLWDGQEKSSMIEWDYVEIENWR